MTETLIIPEFYLYRNDVTRYYLECSQGKALVERCGGKIIDIYIFDFRRHVHCAELRASYEMHYIESIPGGECKHSHSTHEDPDSPYDNDIDEALREVNIETEPVMYVHTFDVEGRDDVQKLDDFFDTETWEELLEESDDREQAHSKAVEHIREGLSCNTPY